jgi:hypothetical protein
MKELTDTSNSFPSENGVGAVLIQIGFSSKPVLFEERRAQSTPQKGTHSGDKVETEISPWKVFMVKSNASEVQKQAVPCFIVMYRLSYSKSLKLDGIKW